MERQLLQLEKDLETFSSHDDPNDMFFTKMAISFTHAFVHSVVWEIIQGAYSRAAMDFKKKMSLKNVVFLQKVNKLPGSRIHHIIKGFYELVSRPLENQNVFQDI